VHSHDVTDREIKSLVDRQPSETVVDLGLPAIPITDLRRMAETTRAPAPCPQGVYGVNPDPADHLREEPPTMAEIEVRTRFDGAWVRGFEVAGETAPGDQPAVRVRRRSDGTVLPAWFSRDDVRVISGKSRTAPRLNRSLVAS
jgi:hypothetical protein